MVFFTVFIFLLGIPSVYSQKDFDLAEEYLKKEDYNNALVEYERVFFASNDAFLQNQALKQKALVYKLQKDYRQSALTLQRIPLYNMTLEEKDSVYYQILLCFYLSDDFSLAQQTMNSMDISLQEKPSKELLLVEILNLNELHDYSSAYNKLLEYEKQVSRLSSEDIHLLDSLYSNIPRQKSGKKARNLSVVPGLGHIYAGYWFEGVTAFVLNAGILAWGVYEFLGKDYLTAWIGGAGLLSAAYTGQQKRAAYLVGKRNYLNAKKFNSKIKEVLLNF